MNNREWKPQYETWRHGGWYVTNVHYPEGFTACVMRSDGSNPDLPAGFYLAENKTRTRFATRDAAARATHVACEMLKAASGQKEEESVSGPTAGQCDNILGKVHYNERKGGRS